MRYLYAIVALGLAIAVHEYGHLLAARLFGIRVHRFAFGIGPPIFTYRRRGIEWVLAAIPIGGSVRVQGMNPHEAGAAHDPASFASRRRWQRVTVLAFGSVINAVVALSVLTALFVAGTHVPVPMEIGTVEPGSVAARAQLLPGDIVVDVDGQPLRSWGDLVDKVSDSPGIPLRLGVMRAWERRVIEVTPTTDERGAGRIGVAQQYVYRQHTVGEALPLAFKTAGAIIRDGVSTLWRLVRGKAGVDLVSPVLIVKQASSVAALGLDSFLRVLVHLSLALALFNLLPFPALDGGRIAFIAFEYTTGRRVHPLVETALHALGFVLLAYLIVLLASSDIRALLR